MRTGELANGGLFLLAIVFKGVVDEEWSARRFVDSGEKPEFIRTCEAKSLYYAGFEI